MIDFSTLFSSTLNPLQTLLTLAVALLVGLFLFFIYKRTFGGVMYSRNFNVSLVMLTLVTSLMLMLINSNLTLSLGMVGALSIIRFRTAVKDPMDTVFMFWAVGEGIAIGTKFYDVAVIAALCIGAILIVMSGFKTRGSEPYLLVVHYNDGASAQIKALMKQLPNPRMKSKTVQREGIELTLELRLRESETGFVEKLVRVDGVYDAALISHRGDIVS